MRRDFKNGNGLFTSLFSGQSVTSKDIQAINAMNQAMQDGKTYAQAWTLHMKGCTVAAKQQAKQCLINKGNLSDLTAELNKNTISAKAGQVALKGLSIAGNMLAMLAISKGIELAVKGIDNLIHSAEHCKERVDELMSSYQSALDKANSNAKTIENLAGKYEELSKGVNNLGENVSLTTDEYAEYNDIVNQIADMFPTLIQGYTNEGNAILKLKGNVGQLRDAYKEAQQEAYNTLITTGEDSDGNDIIEDYHNVLSNDNPFIKLDSSAKEYIDIINSLHEAMLSSDEAYDKLYKDMIWGGKLIKEYNMSQSQFNKVRDVLTDIGFKAELSDEDRRNINNNAKAYVQTYQVEIASALKNVQILANAYLMTNEDYAELDEQSKNAASIIVNSINEGIASGFENKEDVGGYIAKIVDIIKDNPEVQDALVELFKLDITDMQPDKAKELVDQYIRYIAKVLEEDYWELKIRLGFEDVDTIAENYREVTGKAAEKFSKKPVTNLLYGGKLYNPEYLAEKEALDQFAEENSINTQDEIAFWNQCIEESDTREEAMKKYLNSSFITSDTDLSAQLITSQESLDKFQSSIKSASDAYATLLSGNYSPSELLDSIQTINQAIKDMDGKINWEFINSQTQMDSLELLGMAIESVSETYAESILSDAGIDVDSKFGQMLANSIIQAQRASMQLEVLDHQIDSLQNAYSDLSDIVETYNETGSVTFDQLQILLETEPQYLNCLIDENGQLQLNEEAVTALANQRLNDAEAQAVQQAITELGQVALQDEKQAVEENAQAFSNAVGDLAGYNTELANTIAETSVGASEIRNLNAAINGAEVQGATDDQINTILSNLNTKLQMIGNIRSKIKTDGVNSILNTKPASKAGSSAGKSYVDAFEEELQALEDLKNNGLISEKEYLDRLRVLYERYFKDRLGYETEYARYQRQYLDGCRSLA